MSASVYRGFEGCVVALEGCTAESVVRESGEAKLPGEDEYFENFV